MIVACVTIGLFCHLFVIEEAAWSYYVVRPPSYNYELRYRKCFNQAFTVQTRLFY